MAVGAIEPRFYKAFIKRLDLPAHEHERAAAAQMDVSAYPALRRIFSTAFARHDQAHWRRVYHGVDACVTPVEAMHTASMSPHNRDRGAIRGHGPGDPAPAPRFAGRDGAVGAPPRTAVGVHPRVGGHSVALLKAFGVPPDVCARMLRDGEVVDTSSRL
ncbi:MAG: hypothetical protein SGCHY_001787 [Lobulomycetales sp.]